MAGPLFEPSGDYVVSNLYFDDIYDSAYNEKLDGVKMRNKYGYAATTATTAT